MDAIVSFLFLLQPAVRTRRSDNSQEDLTVETVLSLFSTATSAKAIAKKMFPEVAQLLLAHAYQASELNAAPDFV